MLNTPHTF